MRALTHAIAAAMLLLAGCTDNGIGRKCISMFGDGGVPAGMSTVLESPALECPSRLCLVQTGSGMVTRATCTSNCVTDDDCKDAVTGNGTSDQLCGSNFICAVVTVTGPFKCQKFCMCKDDAQCGVNIDENGAAITPPSCPNPSPTPNCP